MNVLIVTNHYLHGNGGGVFASRAYINSIAEVYADSSITLMYPVIKENIEAIHVNKKLKRLPVLSNKLKAVKFIELFLGKIHRFMREFKSELNRNKYNIVIFDNSRCSYKLIDISHKHGAKVVVIHHNYEYEYTKDNTRGLLKYILLFWIKRTERDALQQSDLNLTLTQHDADSFVQVYGAPKSKIDVLGCFESKNIIYKKNDNIIEDNTFAITGNLSSVQTEESLVPWITEYYQILRNVMPDAKLILAGKSPSQRLVDIAHQNQIELIQSPISMDSVINRAKYYLCVTSLGSGLKLRIMDGLRMGLPVITHIVSARGYEKFKEHGCLLTYHDKSSFRKVLEKLKEEKVPHGEEVVNIYDKVFSFQSGVSRLRTILNDKL